MNSHISPEPHNMPTVDEHYYSMTELDTDPEVQAKRGWKLTVNGEEIPVVSSVKLENANIGTIFAYGKRQEGYDGPILKERGGGGAVTLPYMVEPGTGVVYVGLICESRPTMKEEFVWNAPRGMLDLNESHDIAATRELEEETGFEVKRVRGFGANIIKLAGGLNSNTTFFDTTGSPEETQVEEPGISMYAVQLDQSDLDKNVDENGNVTYSFKQEVRDAAPTDKTTERILGSMFLPLAEAMKSKDIITAAAAGYLLTGFITGAIEHPTLNPASMPKIEQ